MTWGREVVGSRPLPPLPLEIGPLNAARGSGGARYPKLNLVHFSLKI